MASPKVKADKEIDWFLATSGIRGKSIGFSPLNLKRPFCVAISAPNVPWSAPMVTGCSGKLRRVSNNNRAGNAIEPFSKPSTSKVVVITVCKSDAVNINLFPSNSTKMFSKIGMIGLLATTPLMADSCFNKTLEATKNFIAFNYWLMLNSDLEVKSIWLQSQVFKLRICACDKELPKDWWGYQMQPEQVHSWTDNSFVLPVLSPCPRVSTEYFCFAPIRPFGHPINNEMHSK